MPTVVFEGNVSLTRSLQTSSAAFTLIPRPFDVACTIHHFCHCASEAQNWWWYCNYMEQQPDKKTIGPRWDFCVSLVVMSSPDHLMIYTVSVPNRSLASIVWCWEVSNNSWRNSIRLPLLKRLFIFNKWYFTFVKWLLLKVKQYSKQLQRLGKMFLKDLSLYIL